MFDQIVREAAERYGLGDQAGPLVQNVVSMITDENKGGVMAFLKGFGEQGMASAVSSWISKGENEPLSASQVESGLGSGAVSEIAGKLGLDPGVVGNAMSFVIPRIVDQLTPDGGIPTSPALVSRLGGLLGGR